MGCAARRERWRTHPVATDHSASVSRVGQNRGRRLGHYGFGPRDGTMPFLENALGLIAAAEMGTDLVFAG